jgi:hypothetical protein
VFVAEMRPLLKDKGALKEIPRARRWAHRPGLKSLFSARVRQDIASTPAGRLPPKSGVRPARPNPQCAGSCG